MSSSKAVWLKQINRLITLPGVDRKLLLQVRAWVQHGVKAVFSSKEPGIRKLQNSSSFRSSEKVCMERMQVYEDMGALRRLAGLPPPGAHVQPLHAVVKQGKKARVCVDLSQNWNDFVEDESFSMSSVQDAVEFYCGRAPPAITRATGRRAW